jgi:hypothetical protein
MHTKSFSSRFAATAFYLIVSIMIWKIASSSQEQNIPRPGKKNMSSHSNGILSFQGQQSFIASSPKAKRKYILSTVIGSCMQLQMERIQ